MEYQNNLTPTDNRIHWPSLLQFGFSLIGIAVLWSSALGAIALGLTSVFSNSQAFGELTTVFLLAAGLVLTGLLLLPSAVYALGRMVPQILAYTSRVERFGSPRLVLWLLLALLLALVAGHFIFGVESIAWLLLPPLHMLAVGLPVLLLVILGARGLRFGSPQRLWGTLAAGLVLGPVVILAAEILVGILAVAVFIVYVSARPDLAAELQLLAVRIGYAAENPQDLARVLRPYLAEPVLLFGIAAFVAGVVPIIEEMFKPIGVWLLVGRHFSPAEGFVAGLLSGAGFALFENISYTTMGDNWTEIVLVRIGTAALHIFTSGLVGWGLGMAWSRKGYLTLGWAYLLAVLVHGLWNFLSVIMSYTLVLNLQDPTQLDLLTWPFGVMLFIILAMLGLLAAFNRRLRTEQPPLGQARGLETKI